MLCHGITVPEKKGAGGHPCLFCQKARILSDFAQIITDFGYVKDVVAKLDSFVEQDRNQLVEPSFEFWIGIHIQRLHRETKF